MAERQQRKAAANRRNAAELLADDIQDDFVEEKAPKSRKSSDKIERVRVWWPPTRNKARSGFSGAYWPAIVVKKGGNFLEVEYDNGEREKVDPDNIFPHEVPIDFGKEGQALEVGEFVEVSNNSKTDPCAWVGCVASIGKKYLIDYPFHDSPSEYIKVELLRRARVWDDLDWKYIEVGQQWKPGEVTSPIELNLLPEKDYFADLKQGAGSSKGKGKRVAAKAAAAEESEESEDDKEEEDQEEEEEEGSSEEEPQPRKQTSSRKRGRPRKPVHPTRASLDEGSNGSGDDNKNDRPKGAKKRKPAAVRQAHTQQQQQHEEDKGKEKKQEEEQSQQRQQRRPGRPPKAAAIEVVARTPATAAAGRKAAATPRRAAAAPPAAAAPGTATAPMTLNELMQSLSQPVLLMPASTGGQQGPMMLLLPKGTNPAGLGAASALPIPVGAAAAAGVAGDPGLLNLGNLGGQDSRASGAAKPPLRGSGLPSAAFAQVAAAAAAAGTTSGGTAALPSTGAGLAVPAAVLGAADLEDQLSQLDLTAARLALGQRYTTEAYLLLVDCWRADSPRLADALRSFRAHVLGNPQPDYQAFMVGIYGLERLRALELGQQVQEGEGEQLGVQQATSDEQH